MNPLLANILDDIDTNFAPGTPPGGVEAPCPQQQGTPALKSIATGLATPPTAEQLAAAQRHDHQAIAGGGSLKRREEAKKTVDDLRKTPKPEDPPRYPNHIHMNDVAENQWAFSAARQILEKLNPDVIVGIERGGRLMAETASNRIQGAADKLLVIPKEANVNDDSALRAAQAAEADKPEDKRTIKPTPEGKARNLDKNEAYIVEKLMEQVRDGARTVAITESWFGGGNQSSATKIMKAFLAKAAEEGHPDVTATMIFFRERVGFEHGGVDDGIVTRPTAGTPNLQTVIIPVRFLAGEDVNAIADDRAATDRLKVFDDEGRTRDVSNDPNKTTRQQFIDLMNATA